MFPVSWLIQSRLAEVATIVDENINGVRVVKSFVAEQRELTTLARGGRPAQVGLRQGRRPARAVHAGGPEPAAGRPRADPAGRRLPGDPRPARRRRDPRLQRLHRDAPGAVPDARDAGHARPARGRVGEADLRGARRAADDRRRARTRSTWSSCRGRRRASTRSTSPTRDGPLVLEGLQPAPAARGDGRDGRAHRQRQDDGLAAAAALLRRHRRRRPDRRPRRARR